MLEYQRPDTALTLRQGLAELRRADGDVSDAVAPDLARALEAHDAVHVVFGLDVSEVDEVVAHAWMLLGTTLTMAELHRVAGHRDHRRMSAALPPHRKALLVARALPRLVDAAWRARRRSRRWPWLGYGAHLDVPLGELRRAFGIRLRERPAESGTGRRGPHHRLAAGKA